MIRIPVAEHKKITLDRVPETLEGSGIDGTDGIDPERALEYGRAVISTLTDALSQKIYLIGLNRRNPSRWHMDYGHHRLVVPPAINWGVVGIDRLAGTVAAELALREESTEVGYASTVSFPGLRNDSDVFYDRIWTRLTVTNPDLQSLESLSALTLE